MALALLHNNIPEAASEASFHSCESEDLDSNVMLSQDEENCYQAFDSGAALLDVQPDNLGTVGKVKKGLEHNTTHEAGDKNFQLSKNRSSQDGSFHLELREMGKADLLDKHKRSFKSATALHSALSDSLHQAQRISEENKLLNQKLKHLEKIRQLHPRNHTNSTALSININNCPSSITYEPEMKQSWSKFVVGLWSGILDVNSTSYNQRSCESGIGERNALKGCEKLSGSLFAANPSASEPSRLNKSPSLSKTSSLWSGTEFNSSLTFGKTTSEELDTENNSTTTISRNDFEMDTFGGDSSQLQQARLPALNEAILHFTKKVAQKFEEIASSLVEVSIDEDSPPPTQSCLRLADSASKKGESDLKDELLESRQCGDNGNAQLNSIVYKKQLAGVSPPHSSTLSSTHSITDTLASTLEPSSLGSLSLGSQEGKGSNDTLLPESVPSMSKCKIGSPTGTGAAIEKGRSATMLKGVANKSAYEGNPVHKLDIERNNEAPLADCETRNVDTSKLAEAAEESKAVAAIIELRIKFADGASCALEVLADETCADAARHWVYNYWPELVKEVRGMHATEVEGIDDTVITSKVMLTGPSYSCLRGLSFIEGDDFSMFLGICSCLTSYLQKIENQAEYLPLFACVKLQDILLPLLFDF